MSAQNIEESDVQNHDGEFDEAEEERIRKNNEILERINEQ